MPNMMANEIADAVEKILAGYGLSLVEEMRVTNEGFSELVDRTMKKALEKGDPSGIMELITFMLEKSAENADMLEKSAENADMLGKSAENADMLGKSAENADAKGLTGRASADRPNPQTFPRRS